MLHVPLGVEKPYFDRGGVIWLKSGSDKRRVNAKEKLRRLFQSVDQFHADELPTKDSLDKLDKLRFRDFLREGLPSALPGCTGRAIAAATDMNLGTDEGVLNLAGMLLFAERPGRACRHCAKRAHTCTTSSGRASHFLRRIHPPPAPLGMD